MDKNEEREAVSVSAHPELSEVFIHTLPPSVFPLCSPSSRDGVLPSFDLVSHSETQYRVDMKRNEKHGIVFPQTVVSAEVICVMLSTALSRPVSLCACLPACLPACRLSISLHTLLRTAVFLFFLFPLYQIVLL